MIPRTNNIYGQIVAPDGLKPVCAALEHALEPGSISLFRARASSARETLRIRTDSADFESISMPGGIEHLFNGAVGGTPDEVIAFVRALSAELVKAKIEHTFDVHDGRRIVISLP